MSAVAVQEKNTTPWWLILVFGILQVVVGVYFLTQPLTTAKVFTWLIGWYWLVTGAYYLVSLIWDRRQWGWKLFSGIIGVAAGWFLVDADPIARVASFGFAIVLVLGIQGIIMGISGLIAAFQGGGLGAGIMGGISIVVGILLLGNMAAATLVLPWVIGIFAIVGGIFAIIMAFRLK
ncbi:MAG: DUF308 domain-containing protein [Caldilinea sp.]|nr:DUF308 domain-containing protein [Caldilinea sp.]MCB0056753.1 DUF308 domain-containing protein [Caldilineaceae bacterium]MCB0038277.1 DUF308 domain-containing protein [Caldilinea sp.]MCB0067914.1 DUF308 domain-containing protein [Caldilineaceae bacterium]MCB0137115.1 DUF308 domain-containing protein [Caldilineaceae bacterium]